MSFQYVTIHYCAKCQKYCTSSPYKEQICQQCGDTNLDDCASINPEKWLEIALNENKSLNDLRCNYE